MTAGVSVASGNSMLNLLGDVYVQMHIGDPGSTGTSNIAIFSTRVPGNLGTAIGAVRSLVSPVAWSAWTGAEQIVTHISAWTAVTGGTFVFSAALPTHATFSPGLIPRLNLLSISIPSVAID